MHLTSLQVCLFKSGYVTMINACWSELKEIGEQGKAGLPERKQAKPQAVEVGLREANAVGRNVLVDGIGVNPIAEPIRRWTTVANYVWRIIKSGIPSWFHQCSIVPVTIENRMFTLILGNSRCNALLLPARVLPLHGEQVPTCTHNLQVPNATCERHMMCS